MGETILVVDDNAVNLKLLRITLVQGGYDVLTATSCEDAANVVKTSRPDLILLDLRLPGMDGLKFAELMKSAPETRRIAIVAVTAFASDIDEVRAFAAGCDFFVRKPIDTRKIASTVAEVLARMADHYDAGDSYAESCVAGFAEPAGDR